MLDVDDIEGALEQAIGLHFIFSEQLGKPAFGVVGIEEWWTRFSTGSNPILTPEMVLAGRDDQALKLLGLFEEDIRSTTIAAASNDDVLAFVAATLLSAAEGRRFDLLSRTLVVRSTDALRVLDVGAKLLILLPFDEALYREAQLIRSHHFVFAKSAGTPADLDLEILDRDKFAELLHAAGVDEPRVPTTSREQQLAVWSLFSGRLQRQELA